MRGNDCADEPGDHAALGSPEPTGQVSDGAAPLWTGGFSMPHAQCQSSMRVHGGPVALCEGSKL